MMSFPITPPVAEPELEAVAEAVQAEVKTNKSAVIAAIIHVAVLLTAALGLHLSATDTAIIGSLVTSGVAYFATVNLKQAKL